MTQNFRWTDVLCMQEARKFSSRKDFAKKGKGAYGYALKKGILDRVCSHMK